MRTIRELLAEKQRLEGNLSPDGAWIECAPVYGRKDWVQAYWRSYQKIFGGKYRKYIGKKGSPKHQKALEQVANRHRWESLKNQIEMLEKVDYENRRSCYLPRIPLSRGNGNNSDYLRDT